ncbi:MAG: redoxin domain-containing protein [Dysgonomonas sp.]|nr:redoxin domain-containing protein [Dysgonomonas sp.]
MKPSILNIVFVLVISIISIGAVSCTDNTDTNFSVDGKLENLSVSQIYAVREISKDSLTIDTILIKEEGEFSYKRLVDFPTLVSLSCGEGTKPLVFYLDTNYHVKIKGDILSPNLVEIKGGAVNDDLQNFRNKNESLLQSRSRILNKNENMDPAELRNINLQLAKNVRKYVEENPTKISSVILMNQYSINNLTPEQLGEDIELLKGPAASFYLTTSLRGYYDRVKTSSIGAKAPDITLKNSKGKKISLTDFKGKPVLLIFDLKDAPLNTVYFDALKDAQKKLKKDVNFVSIVIDEDESKPDPNTVKIANALDWTVLFDGKKWNSKEVKKYDVKTAPYMILISSDGIIEERDVSLDSLVYQFDINKIEEKEK